MSKQNIDEMSNDELDDLVLTSDQDRELEVAPPGQPMPNVRRFLAAKFHHQDHLLLVHQGGQFYEWNGRCWPAIEDKILHSRLYRWFETRWYIDQSKKVPTQKPFAPTLRKVADLVDATKAITIIETSIPTPSWFGASDVPANELIAAENGLIHWPTRKLRPHTPHFYVHHAVPFAFAPNAPSPARWLAFLRELWGDDDESINCLQEMFGYLLSGDTSQQKMFLLVGPKRGGKGTIGRVLTRLLGRHNVAGPTLSTLGTNFGLQDLIAKPVAIVSDARLGAKSDHSLITERLLSVSGEDLQNVDRKFQSPWSGQLPTRFVILTNELPRLSDSSGALASRFIVLMLERSFYNKENPKLTDELSEEIAGIFNWALDGLHQLRARGRFQPPTTSKEAILALEDLASPVGAFMRERCRIGAQETVEAGLMYQTYRTWCEEHGRHAVNQQVFGRDLRAVRPEVRVRQLGSDRHRHYAGIGLRTADNAPAPQWENTRESRESASDNSTSSRDSRVNMHCSARTCAHCGMAETEGSPLLTVAVNGTDAPVHRGCMAGWRAAQ